MVSNLIKAALFAVTFAAASSAYAADGPLVLKSEKVELPTSDHLFPPGTGADVTNTNCLTCHSAAMVLTQPPLSKAGWEAEVAKMRAVYKAPIAPQDTAGIVAYLTSIKGSK